MTIGVSKKNLLAVLLIVSSIILILAGTLASFSEKANADIVGQAGTVKISADFSNFINAAIANINPGDHDSNLKQYLGAPTWSDIHPGIEHKLEAEISNLGNKSVKVRDVIDILVTPVDPGKLNKNEFMLFLTTATDRTAADAESKVLTPKYFLFSNGSGEYDVAEHTGDGYYTLKNDGTPDTKIATDITDCIGVRFVLFNPEIGGGCILQGIGNNAENVASVDGIAGPVKRTYYLGLKATADNNYQGAKITVDWVVEAMQNRNTDDATDWTKISSATATGYVPANNEDASGTEIP